MATHSSLLAWRIPRTEKPGRLQSVGSHRVGHNRRVLAHTHRQGHPCALGARGPLGDALSPSHLSTDKVSLKCWHVHGVLKKRRYERA